MLVEILRKSLEKQWSFVLLFFSDLQKNSNIKTPPIKSFKLFKQKLTSEYVSYSFTDVQIYSNIKKIITSVFGSKSPLFQETSSLRLSEFRRWSIHGFYFLIKIAGGCLPFVQFLAQIVVKQNILRFLVAREKINSPDELL